MNDKDNSVIIAGVAIMILVLIGSVLFEGEAFAGGASGSSFNVTIEEKDLEIASETGNLNEGQSDDYVYTITQEDVQNIAYLEFVLTWDDNVPGATEGNNDEFSLEANGNDSSESQADESGSITIKIDIHQVPAESGDDPAVGGTGEEVVEMYGNTFGYGEYNVTVTCVDAGPYLPSPAPDNDNGNSYTMKVNVHYYEVTAEQIIVVA